MKNAGNSGILNENNLFQITSRMHEIENDAVRALQEFKRSIRFMEVASAESCPHWISRNSSESAVREYMLNKFNLRMCTFVPKNEVLDDELKTQKYDQWYEKLNYLKDLLSYPNFENKMKYSVKMSKNKNDHITSLINDVRNKPELESKTIFVP